MTLDDTLLPDPANWRAEGDHHLLNVTEGAWTATLTATALDQIGCRLWEVRTAPATPPAEPVDVRATAERLVGRATGLLEALRFLEADADRGVALCRSEEPTTRQDQRYYYELLVRNDGGVELRRYQAATPGERRQQVAFSLTHEALIKLLGDLTRS